MLIKRPMFEFLDFRNLDFRFEFLVYEFQILVFVFGLRILRLRSYVREN